MAPRTHAKSKQSTNTEDNEQSDPSWTGALSYSQIFTSYSRAVCKTIFAATYSELSADIRVFFPGRVPGHIRRHIFAVLRSLFTLILLQANNTNKKARIKVNSIWNKPSLRISEST